MAVELDKTILVDEMIMKQQVKHWMAPPSVIHLGDELTHAIEMLIYQKCQDIIVLKNKRFVAGLLSCSTLFKLLLEGNPNNGSISEDMIIGVQPVYTEDSILSISFLSGQTIPVCNQNNELVGMLNSDSLIHAYNYIADSKSHTNEILDIILESAYEGIVVVDEQGIIRKMNDAYKNFLGVRHEDVLNRHVKNVIENTRMHICVETGIPERGHIQEIQGQNMVVHRIPIWRNNQIAGAIGMLIFEGVTDLYKILERASETNRKKIKKDRPLEKERNESKITFESIIGESSELMACKSVARRASRTMATVLITGESGTGKEMFARAIHNLSACAGGPFVSLNCAAIPEHLLEAELFGYEDGAFTGARKGGKLGKFEIANNGTLFLDEIGDMPLPMQAKILRVLQEREIERVGGSQKIPFNVRIIAATNHELENMVNENLFREDLFYRLNIIKLEIPQLRNRKQDIPILMSHYLDQFCEEYGFELKTFTREAIEAIMQYDWPGNIREVVNAAERLVALVEEKTIQFHDLPNTITEEKNIDFAEAWKPPVSLKKEKIEQEKQTIQRVLDEMNGNKSKTAERLGIHRSTLYQKLKRFDIQ